MKPKKQNTAPKATSNTDADEYLLKNIEEAKANKNKACDLYRNYVGESETQEERLRRINMFRSGGGW